MKKLILVLMMVVVIFNGTVAFAADVSREEVIKKFTPEKIRQVGDHVYNTPGAQTCLKCHQAGGVGEGWAGAADLRKPYKWNSFTTLGGYDALKSDPAKLRAQMEEVLTYLVANGAIRWNLEFAKKHPEIKMDWSKSVKKGNNGQFDMMMWGAAQPEMKKKIKEIQLSLKTEGVTLTDEEMRVLAVYAVLEYIKGFEEPNKETPDAPKIWS